jgi:hypothetical protein
MKAARPRPCQKPNERTNLAPAIQRTKPMIHRSTPNTSAAPVSGRIKPSTKKLKIKSALSTGLIRSKRLLGTLHLSPLVWPR